MTFVGIFWAVPQGSDASILLVDRTPLPQATDYAGRQGHDRGHADLWDQLKGYGATGLRRLHLPTIIAASEFDDWPRGRAVHDPRQGWTFVYADARLHTPAFIRIIASALNLTPGSFIMGRDEHYARSRAVGHPTGFIVIS